MARRIQKFEDLDIWREGMGLVRDIYRCMRTCKDFNLRDQTQRAAVSIPSNIAEGFERGGNREFIRYLLIAKGSCGELRTYLYLIKDLGYVDEGQSMGLIEKTRKESSTIYKLVEVRRERFS